MTPLLTEPSEIFVYIIVLIGALYWVGDQKFAASFFRYLPQPIWIYFLPMLSSYFGIIPHVSPFYDWVRNYLLPSGLVLMLLSANLPGLAKLGPKALGIMAFATSGIIIGATGTFALLHNSLPDEAWKGIAALTGSWIGGSANMVAVAKSVGTPDSMLGPIIVVDTVVGYGWMGVVIALSAYQVKFDKWNKVDTSLVTTLNKRMMEIDEQNRRHVTIKDLIFMLAIGFGVGFLTLKVGPMLPPVGEVLNAFGWTVVLATIVGVLLSLTRLSELEFAGASNVGSVLFYMLLATIGAKADIAGILDAPLFALAGVMIIATHASMILLGGHLLKVPMFLMATSSQANIGGPVTAPIVAGIYQHSLAAVGLLLAVLGNVLGIFGGLFVAQLCYWIVS
ncbi:MAG TPA: DUF819 family protein [Bacteroidota bacterium]